MKIAGCRLPLIQPHAPQHRSTMVQLKPFKDKDHHPATFMGLPLNYLLAWFVRTPNVV